MASLCSIGNDNSIINLKELTEEELLFHNCNIEYASNLILVYSSTQSLDLTFFQMNELVTDYIKERISYAAFVSKIATSCDNYLSAVRNYLDAFAHTLSESFGKDSNIYVDFGKKKSQFFDANFSYRLVEQLRNYCQHRKTPIHTITANVENGKKQVKLLANTSTLLADKKFCTKHLENLQRDYPEDIDLLYHFKVMYGCLKNINHIIFMQVYDPRKTEIFFQTARSLLNEKNDLAVMNISPTENNGLNMRILGCYRLEAVQKIINDELEVERLFFTKS